MWHGVKENTLMIELAGITLSKVREIASDLAVISDQESVMIVHIPVETEFVSAERLAA
jgi:hypothetical protein